MTTSAQCTLKYFDKNGLMHKEDVFFNTIISMKIEIDT